MTAVTFPSRPATVASAAGSAGRRAPPRWVAPVVLAAPFLVAIAALRGLTAALPIFHGSDERVYQVPTILRFGSQLPFPDVAHYNAAQTPLFHLTFAYLGKLTGYELWRLRLLEVLISYALALAVFALFARRLRLPYWPSLALTLLFVLSPYVYGSSFRVITDNLATLFVVLAVERLERFRETDRLGPFVAACASIAAATLTRQSAAFMLAVAVLYALRAQLPWRDRILALGAVGLAAAPLGALFLTWHGLVPPGGDPSSCGLCPAGRAGPGAARGTLQLQTAELTLATIGLYGAVLFPPLLVARVPWPPHRAAREALLRSTRGPLVGAACGIALLAVWPATPGAHAAGLIWRAAQRLPSVGGSSLLFWALVPLSGAILWARIRGAPRRSLVVVFLGCFLVAALAIRYPWQKYVDPFALLVLLLTVRGGEFGERREFLGVAVLAVGFVAYTVSFLS